MIKRVALSKNLINDRVGYLKNEYIKIESEDKKVSNFCLFTVYWTEYLIRYFFATYASFVWGWEKNF